jgi:hypothetical protein
MKRRVYDPSHFGGMGRIVVDPIPDLTKRPAAAS